MMLFVCKDRTRALIAFFLSGTTACLFSGEIVGLIVKSSDLSIEFIIANLTPFFEELCKMVPILFYAIVFCPKRQQLFECSFAIGAGFAVQENAFILASLTDNISLPLALSRGFGAGMLHVVCTLGVTYGISFIRKRRKLFAPYTMALLTTSVTYHSAYNQLLQSRYAGFVIMMPMLTFALIIFVMKRQKLL